MAFFDFLKKEGVLRTLRVGQVAGKVLRKRVEDRLSQGEARAVQKKDLLDNLVEEELSQSLKQFLRFRQNPNAIGFMKVDFFSLHALERGRRELGLPPNQILALNEVHSFLSQCNTELEKIEVRKDGFIKGNLPEVLLDRGKEVLEKALLVFENRI
tara:strand:- start:1028 stop:1495 length:468 start_codon:yes stop_codon:yes gene_type:complete